MLLFEKSRIKAKKDRYTKSDLTNFMDEFGITVNDGKGFISKAAMQTMLTEFAEKDENAAAIEEYNRQVEEARQGAGGIEDDDADFEDDIDPDRLEMGCSNGYNLSNLQEYARQVHLDTTGNREDVIERLQ